MEDVLPQMGELPDTQLNLRPSRTGASHDRLEPAMLLHVAAQRGADA
jgi:hypothetical protein